MQEWIGTIRMKWIGSFLGVVLIFALGAMTAGINAQRAGTEARAFLDEYWPTADLLMETRILLGEIAAQVINPPAGTPAAEIVENARKRIGEIGAELERANLAPEVVNRLRGQLAMVEEALPLPVLMHDEPGIKMEEADAAVQPLLEKMGALRDPAILNTTWEAVMSFNDILITGDQVEKENFLTHIRKIEGHPRFASFREEYVPFKASAEDVFASAIELQQAQQRFLTVFDNLAADLKALEKEFQATVILPASDRIHDSLALILQTMVWATLISAALSLLVGYLMARGVCGPIDRVKAMLGRMEQGYLDSRVRLNRHDEIGGMAEALDRMAENLSAMVRQVRRSTDELAGVSRHLVNSANSVDGATRRQADEVAKASSAMAAIRSSAGEVGRGIDRLTGSAAESTSSVLEMSANIEEVAQNAETLAVAVDQATSSIQEMAASMRQISESVHSLKEASDTTVSSIVQVDVSVRQVEENSRETRVITEEVRKEAERGRGSVEATIRGIDEIRQAARTSSEIILALAGRAQDIGKILQVIEEVTERTNLLALNAAIIAAQSGEHGRGFAVVAEEIRELADRTRHSTQEIAGMIDAVQGESRQAVEAIGRAEGKIGEGENLSRESGEVLVKIVAGIDAVGRQMDQIARATAEQSKGSRMIRSAMESVAEMVNQIATATAEQEKGGQAIRAAAESMREATAQVRNSTREQSGAAKNIARSTEDINEMIQSIKAACEEQDRHGRGIDDAVFKIRDSADSNLEVAKVLTGAVSSLAGQVAVLQQEMTVFKGMEGELEPDASSMTAAAG